VRAILTDLGAIVLGVATWAAIIVVARRVLPALWGNARIAVALWLDKGGA
jgi:thiol:disulfide interchange protein